MSKFLLYYFLGRKMGWTVKEINETPAIYIEAFKILLQEEMRLKKSIFDIGGFN